MATFATPPLDHDVTVTGNVEADLIASTSGTDSDWVVKLIDVFPDRPHPDKSAEHAAPDPACRPLPEHRPRPQRQSRRLRTHDCRRNLPRPLPHELSQPEAIPANTPEEYKFTLHAADHVFLKGHRIMVQVQSTWFPLYDRNPQTFVPSIMTAKPADYHPAEQQIYAASHIELPIPE